MKIKGFTPMFDSLAHKYDPYTALVYGKIWRICDWSEMGICTMSNEKIAEQLGMSEKTIRRKKEILGKDKLIKLVGGLGTTDSVVVCHEVVMEMELDYGADFGGSTVDSQSKSTDSQSETSDTVSDKDSTKIEKEDIIDGMLKHSGKKDKLEGCPPAHADLLRPFCEFYRYPFKDELKAWIAQAEIWISRKYTTRDVINACKYVVYMRWEYYQPSSINKAFGKKIPVDKQEYDAVAERAKSEAKHG